MVGGRRCERRDLPPLPTLNERSCETGETGGDRSRAYCRQALIELGTPLASAWMPRTRLRISCVHCGRPVALVGDISLSVLTLLATHLQRRHPGEQLGAHPGEDAILSHLAITPVNPGSEPPDAA